MHQNTMLLITLMHKDNNVNTICYFTWKTHNISYPYKLLEQWKVKMLTLQVWCPASRRGPCWVFLLPDRIRIPLVRTFSRSRICSRFPAHGWPVWCCLTLFYRPLEDEKHGFECFLKKISGAFPWKTQCYNARVLMFGFQGVLSRFQHAVMQFIIRQAKKKSTKRNNRSPFRLEKKSHATTKIYHFNSRIKG